MPSRLKEALKAAKESLEKRLQEEQRLVGHFLCSHTTSINIVFTWMRP